MLVWGLLYLWFGEKLPASNGLGVDGIRYADITRNLWYSRVLDDYYALRTYPPALIHSVFSTASIEFSDRNIIRAFELLSLGSLVLATYTLGLILDELKICHSDRFLGFCLFLISYPVLKGGFYVPVATDAISTALGALIFLFFIRGNSIQLAMVSFIAAFTLPLLLYLGCILLIFPRQASSIVEMPKPLRMFFRFLSGSFILSLTYYWVFHRKVAVDARYALQIDPDLVYLSTLVLVGAYLFIPDLFSNRDYFKPSYWLKSINPLNLLAALILLITVRCIADYINFSGHKSGYLTAYHMLSTMATVGVVRPAIFLTSYFWYFGVIIILIPLFWRRFCHAVMQFGPGLSLALVLVFVLFLPNTQSRVLNCIFVWFVVLFLYSIRDIELPRTFYYLVPFLNVLVSKIWLPVRYGPSPVNSDGTIGFPNQTFMMTAGFWVSEYVWFLQLVGLVLILTGFYFLLFEFRFSSNTLTLVSRTKLCPQLKQRLV